MQPTATVFKAIHEVMGVMSSQGIGKDRKNQQQGYKFRGIDDVLNALSAAMVQAGLLCVPRVLERQQVERQNSKGGTLFFTTVKVDFDLISVEDGSKHTVTTYGEAMDSADKATNKAMSAAYKYMALLTFCIPTEATPDNDADFTTHDVAPQQRPEPMETISEGDKRAMRESIRDATDMSGLRLAFNRAYKRATSAGDTEFMDDINALKEDRKAYLESLPPPDAATHHREPAQAH